MGIAHYSFLMVEDSTGHENIEQKVKMFRVSGPASQEEAKSIERRA